MCLLDGHTIQHGMKDTALDCPSAPVIFQRVTEQAIREGWLPFDIFDPPPPVVEKKSELKTKESKKKRATKHERYSNMLGTS